MSFCSCCRLAVVSLDPGLNMSVKERKNEDDRVEGGNGISSGSKLSTVTPVYSLGSVLGEEDCLIGSGIASGNKLSTITPMYSLGCGEDGDEPAVGGNAMSAADSVSTVTPEYGIVSGVEGGCLSKGGKGM